MPRPSTIDLNADLGEGSEADAELLRFVSSANVCCGAHAGSRFLTALTVRRAVDSGVCIGAHPGYPDRQNFGRWSLAMKHYELVEMLERQLSLLLEAAAIVGGRVAYLKPHGALYHACSEPGPELDAVLACAKTYGMGLLHQPHSTLLAIAEREGVACASEGFADRRYLGNGRLVPRTEPDAMIDDQEQATTQALQLALGTGGFTAVDSICLHGDHAGALASAEAIRGRFAAEGLTVRSQF